MWDLAVREKDFQAVDSMLARYRGSVPLSFRLVPARGRRDASTVARLLTEARTLESRQLQLASRYVAAYLDDPAFADSLTRLDLAWRERPLNRAQAQVQLGWLAVAEGRWLDAWREFEAAERMEGAGAVAVHLAFAATLPFLEPSVSDLEAVRARLTRWRPDLDPGAQAGDVASLLRPHLRQYLLALVGSRRDDEASVASHRDSLQALTAPEGLSDVVGMMIATVDSDRAYRRGHFQTVIDLLSRQSPALPLELLALPRPAHLREYGFEHARLLRGLAAMHLGNDTEALRWLENGFAGSPQELAFRAPVHLDLARVYERMGDKVRAMERYDAGIRLWRRADPELQVRVNDARERLKALSGHADH
jgi:tetratricopeptide (TPR) repeat protein